MSASSYNCILLATLATMASACGGSIKVAKVDMSKLSEAQRAQIRPKQDAVFKADEAATAARKEAEAVGQEVETAKGEVETAEGNLSVARKQLDLEEAKNAAGKDESVKMARAEVDVKEKALKVAEKNLEFVEAKEAYLKAKAKEAEAELKVARADLELTKLKVAGGYGPEYDARVAEFEQQHREAQADHASARKKSAEELLEKHEAEDELNKAKNS